MGDLTNTNGRGPVGTPANSPVSDGGTMPRTQNRPNVSYGAAPGQPGSAAPTTYQFGLTDSDRQFIRNIHRDTPLPLEKLMTLRFESLRLQEDASREFGPVSSSALWLRQVIAAYDEAGVLGDERQKQLMGISDDKSGGILAVIEAMGLIMKRRQAAVSDLLKKQSQPGGGVTDAQVDQAIKDFDEIRSQARRLGISAPQRHRHARHATDREAISPLIPQKATWQAVPLPAPACKEQHFFGIPGLSLAVVTSPLEIGPRCSRLLYLYDSRWFVAAKSATVEPSQSPQ